MSTGVYGLLFRPLPASFPAWPSPPHLLIHRQEFTTARSGETRASFANSPLSFRDVEPNQGRTIAVRAEYFEGQLDFKRFRAAVLANLTLFEPPPETWESEALARRDRLLYDHFDLAERLDAVNKKVDFLGGLNSTLLEVLSVRKSPRLEWIVIILILVELTIFLGADVVPKKTGRVNAWWRTGKGRQDKCSSTH